MSLKKIVVAVVAGAAAAALAVPSQAAAPKTRTLNFDDQYTTGTGNSCTPVWVLTKSAPGDGNCNSIQAGVNNNGDLADNDYGSLKSSVGVKLDTKRPLTGTVYIGAQPFIGGTPLKYMPEQIGADITITINGVTLPTVKGSGVVTPNNVLSVPINIKLPSSLNNKVVKSVDADVSYTSAVGLVGVLYAAPTQSHLTLPTR